MYSFLETHYCLFSLFISECLNTVKFIYSEKVWTLWLFISYSCLEKTQRIPLQKRVHSIETGYEAKNRISFYLYQNCLLYIKWILCELWGSSAIKKMIFSRFHGNCFFLVFVLASISQRPRTDLNERSLSRPKTTPAWKLIIPHRSNICKN